MPLKSTAKIRTSSTPCPICNGRLRGNYATGYHCSGCKSTFTSKHVAYLAKHQLRAIIDKHFAKTAIGEKKLQNGKDKDNNFQNEDNDKAIISYNPIDKKIAVVITETHHATHASIKYLEELLEAQDGAKNRIEETKERIADIKRRIEIAKNRIASIKSNSIKQKNANKTRPKKSATTSPTTTADKKTNQRTDKTIHKQKNKISNKKNSNKKIKKSIQKKKILKSKKKKA